MKLFCFRQKNLSDEEYIAKVRRSVERWDRWRFWMILLYGGALGAITWFITDVVARLAQFGPLAGPGMALGATVGYLVGWQFATLAHNFFSTFRVLRAERLLIEYYDAVNSQDLADDVFDETDSESADARVNVKQWKHALRMLSR